jgi:hypothetical protein
MRPAHRATATYPDSTLVGVDGDPARTIGDVDAFELVSEIYLNVEKPILNEFDNIWVNGYPRLGTV